MHNSAMAITCSLFSLVMMSICGCDERATELPNRPTSPSDANAPNQAISDVGQESVGEARGTADEQLQPDAAEQPLAPPKVTIKPLLPRAIQTEEEAKRCMQAAIDFEQNIREHVMQNTGVAPEALSKWTTKVLKDCVIQYDEDGRGYTKFYPGDTRVRLFLRSSDVCDANFFIPNCETAVLHVTIRPQRPGEADMWITCRDMTGTHAVNVIMHVEAPIWSPGAPGWTRRGDWSQIAEAEELERYCMVLYEEFVHLRGR